MPRRLIPDDEIRRVDARYLGPPGYTFLWHARYQAYGLGVVLMAIVLLVEAALGTLDGIPWREASLVVLVTWAVMEAVDYDKPPLAVAQNVVNVARTPSPAPSDRTTSRLRFRTVKITRTPIHQTPKEVTNEAQSDR